MNPRRALPLFVLVVAALLSASPASAGSTRSRHAERLSVGESHACYAHPSGDVYCWGLNDVGQLGTDPAVAYDSEVPLLVPLPTKALQVVTGVDFTCVLDELGDIYCFGNRAYGRLGDGRGWTGREASPVPQPVAYSGDFVQLAAGSAHACGLRSNGVLFCWGWNAFGQVGPNAKKYQLAPLALLSGAGYIDVTAGSGHTCALRSDRRVECWGDNYAGQLGDGTLTPRPYSLFALESVPEVGQVWLEDVADLEAGWAHTCAIKVDGRVVCWGQGLKGQIGDGHNRLYSTVALANGITDAAALSAGNRADHICVLRGDGNTFCWGRNDHGQIGDGTVSSKVNPPVGPKLSNGVVHLAAGENGTCAALASGELKCWGYNQWGEVGNGTFTKNIATPVTVKGLPTSLASSGRVALGALHTCALKSSGLSYCWGAGTFGQLGDGSSTSRTAPASAVNYTGLGQGWHARELAAGRDFSCAVMSYGSVRCWGKNSVGQLGNGTTTDSAVGVAASGVGTAIDVAAGDSHACAVLADGSVRCWGSNSDGQLGDFTSFDRWTPVRSWADHAFRVAAGQAHTCAITYGGGVECWGRGNEGQLGDGGTASTNGPTRVVDASGAPLTRVIDLAAARASTCALREDGSAWCWGRNVEGQLGNGTTTTETRAVRVDTSASGTFVELAAAGNHVCAVGTVGRGYCWGSNTYGQLGDGTTTDRLVPTAVSNAALPARTLSFATGNRHTCASTVEGTLHCWGYNLVGQVGTGGVTTIEKLPVPVVGFP
jgi:alpha-tubulin suppressor-like RCC1 family protein